MAISRFAASRLTQGLPKYQTVWDQDGVGNGAVQVIGHVDITTPGSAITFNNIPAGYKDLIMITSVRTTFANYSESLAVQINGISTGGLYSQRSIVTADIIYPGGISNANNWTLAQNLAASAPVGAFGNSITNFLNYTSSRFKVALSQHAADYNLSTSGAVGKYAFTCRTTSAISRIDIYSGNGNNFVPGSKATLYGIMGGN